MVAERSIVRNLPAICQFGRYELLGRIAVGGMAEIYLAREPERVAGAGDRHLVIKRVLSHVADDPTFVNMFFDEARLAMRLQHPAIVHMYEFGEEAGSYFLAMEWVDGVALGKTIRKAREQDGVPAPIAVKITAVVAEALHYAHHVVGDDGRPLGIVHRDVSPQNVVISYDGSVKLLDFGIAKAADQSRHTDDGQVKGKFAYMSPQQCVGDEVDGRSDVFALGVCLYEALTGRPLYHRKTQYETMRAVIEDPVPSILKFRPELSPDLDAIVKKALAKQPADRFATAGDMQIALERWLGKQGEVVPPPRIAAYLSELYGNDFRGGPMVDSTPFGQSFQGSIPVPSSSIPPALISGPQSTASAVSSSSAVVVPTRRWLPVALALLLLTLLVGAGVGGYAWWEAQRAPEVAHVAPGAPLATPPPPSAVPVVPALPTPSTANSMAAAVEDPPEAAVPEATPMDEVARLEPTPMDAPAPMRANMRQAPATMAATGAGTLSVNTRPWSKVYVGERLIGTTPIGRAPVDAGTVRLRLVDRDGNEHRRQVEVRAGEDTRSFFDLQGT